VVVTWWAWTTSSTRIELVERVGRVPAGVPGIGHEVLLIPELGVRLVVVNVEWSRSLDTVCLGFGGVTAQVADVLRRYGWEDRRGRPGEQ
jgi:hypothetical protein